jgi:CBS domain-containing protein
MTRFPSRIVGLVLLFATAGCGGKSGTPVAGPLGQDVGYAYIPLRRDVFLIKEIDAGGVALGGGIAVTVAHAEEMIPADKVIGVSADYDLMFFRTERTNPVLTTGEPRLGQKIVSYAHYYEDIYKADGVVVSLDTPVKARCDTCIVQSTFAFDGNAGPGYSGGPVLDAENGKLVGIVFGYLDKPDGGRTIYAYPMSRVFEELRKFQGGKAS